MRKGDVFLGLLAAAYLGLAALGLVFPRLDAEAVSARRAASSELVERLMLTDLALFTEARYTRHPSQADLFSAFQDHPGAWDHFPTGGVIPPPEHLLRPTVQAGPNAPR